MMIGFVTASQLTENTIVVKLVEDWKLARDNRLSVGILSTDMSKAFDSLHPPLMLCKLKAYGFQDSTGFVVQLLVQLLGESAHWISN